MSPVTFPNAAHAGTLPDPAMVGPDLLPAEAILTAPEPSRLIGEGREHIVVGFPTPQEDRHDTLLTRTDRKLFDHGFVRVSATEAGSLEASYAQADTIEVPRLLPTRASDAVAAMSSIGANGRFGNQLFQYAFLFLYGLRNNCRVETAPWVGQAIYGFDDPPCSPGLRSQVFGEFTGVERHLWSLDQPPVNLNFVGYFQDLPASWRHYRSLLTRLFRPVPMIEAPIERWIARNVPGDRTLVAIHVRRGDYQFFDPNFVPWFRTIPVSWYQALLAEIWPKLDRPMLYVATDDPRAILPQFADYAPITAPAADLVPEEIGYFVDHYVLMRADVITVLNSSFSRSAALLARPGQRCFIADMHAERFVPYEAWHETDFWLRFGRRD